MIQNEHMIRVRVRVVAQVPIRVHAHLLNLSNNSTKEALSMTPVTCVLLTLTFMLEIDAVEWKGRNWILQTFQYEEKTVSQHYTQIRNIEKGGE